MASYAAAISDALGMEVQTETGTKGQFDVVVSDNVVVSRKGGLFALITRKPWPTESEVVSAVQKFMEN